MSITLLTAVPGGGKTSYAVWHVIKKAHEEGKIICTCGIPKLKIPTIEITIEQVRKWYEATTNDQNLPDWSILNMVRYSSLMKCRKSGRPLGQRSLRTSKIYQCIVTTA